MTDRRFFTVEVTFNRDENLQQVLGREDYLFIAGSAEEAQRRAEQKAATSIFMGDGIVFSTSVSEVLEDKYEIDPLLGTTWRRGAPPAEINLLHRLYTRLAPRVQAEDRGHLPLMEGLLAAADLVGKAIRDRLQTDAQLEELLPVYSHARHQAWEAAIETEADHLSLVDRDNPVGVVAFLDEELRQAVANGGAAATDYHVLADAERWLSWRVAGDFGALMLRRLAAENLEKMHDAELADEMEVRLPA